MKTISVALAAHLAGQVTSMKNCLRFEWNDDDHTVKGFTDHDQDIVFGGVTYYSISGYDPSDVATSSDLNVDNLQVVGMTDAALSHPSITDEDLLAGRWDFAKFRIFQVNWNDLTMGALKVRAGKLGEVTLDRAKFSAELRGLMQHYATSLGRVETPMCNANLGDSRCTVDLASFTVTSTITGLNPTNELVLYDTARTEDGPTDSRDVTGVTNANPGVISYATAFDPPLTEGEAVVISEVVGPASINSVTIVRSPGDTSFELGVDTSDTSDYPAYVSGGRVSRFSDSGFFDFGVLTMNEGENEGLSREIKSFVPGQFTLQLPFPYPVLVGEEYTAVAGCDKSLPTCRDRFDNVVNFRGFPYLPGMDKIVQVGRRNQ